MPNHIQPSNPFAEDAIAQLDADGLASELPYVRKNRRGLGPRKRRPLAERFFKKVQRTEGDGCWLWTGSFHKTNGYGHIYTGRETDSGSALPTHAHRASWEIHYGSIPDGMFVCHHCDNRLCVRPEHLFLGTHADNMRDMDEKGRRVKAGLLKTHCVRGHLLSGPNVRQEGGRRRCRACGCSRRKKYEQKQKAARYA